MKKYCIPNLQFDLSFLIYSYGLRSELDSDSDIVLFRELSLDILVQHGCLSNP